MKQLLFQVIDESIQVELERKGLLDSYVIEEEGAILVGGRSEKKLESENAILISENLAVDWSSQWESFAENYFDGKAHIDLKPFGGEKELLLYPGAGFGDLSHPTTRLMLEMMQKKVSKRDVIDIGSGSGILTLSALLLGANSSLGIEIDQDSLTHARKNAKLNHLSIKFLKKLSKKLPPNPLFLMNMTFHEQKGFDPSKLKGTWIVSGILESQKKEYLKLAKNWGWTTVEKHKKDGWMGWTFSLG